MISNPFKRFLSADQIETALKEVATLADQAGVAVALVGGVALQLYGSDRFTRDVDFVTYAHTSGLFIYNHTSGFFDAMVMSIGGVQGKTKSGIPVDFLFGGEYPKLYEEALQRAERTSSLPVPVARLAHIIAMKMVARRAKDEGDIETMLRIGAVDVAETKSVIKRHLGTYGAKEFMAVVDEVAWRSKLDEERSKK